jgi:tetratricopeptide (TPR) repeat protein
MIRRILPLALVFGLFLGCTPAPPVRSNSQMLQDAERSMLMGQWEKAAGHYETFLAENPGDAQRAELRMQIGKCRLAGGQTEPAIRAFDQALNDQPPQQVRWEIVFRRSVACRMQGDAVRAVEGFRSVAAAPSGERGRSVTNDELHYELAIALFRTGDFRGGQAELRLVGPTGPYEKQVGARLGLMGYTIQVASYGREELARVESDKVSGRIRPVPGSPPLFQVMVGSFPRYEDAQRELTRFQRQGYTDAFILP